MASIIEQLDSELWDVILVRYFLFGSAALLVYDHFLTIPSEVEYIWKGERSLGKVLFLYNRYVSLAVVGVDIYQLGGLVTDLTVPFCKAWVLTEAIAIIISLAIVNLIIAIRIHALYSGARWVKILLAVSWTSYVAATLVVTIYLMVSEILPTVGPIPIVNICYGSIPVIFFLIWVPSIFFEFVSISLTIWRAWHDVRHQSTSLISRLLYRDGFMYNAVKLLVLLANVFVFAFANRYLVILLKEFVFVSVNVIGSRMTINLREAPVEARKAASEQIELRNVDVLGAPRITRSQDVVVSAPMRGASRVTFEPFSYGQEESMASKEDYYVTDGSLSPLKEEEPFSSYPT